MAAECAQLCGYRSKGDGKGKSQSKPPPPPNLSRAQMQSLRTPYKSQPRPALRQSNKAQSSHSDVDCLLTRLAPRPTADPAAMELSPLLRVAAVSAMPQPAEDWGNLLRRTLAEYPPELRPQLLVLPEGGIMEPGPCDCDHPIVRELTPIAADFGLVIAAGTMVVQDGQWFGNVCPVISGAGLLGSCRKRHQGAFSDASADPSLSGPPPIFDTPIGKLGVLICLDIEDDALLSEVAERCAILANPAHIPHLRSGNWQIAQDTIRRRLEWWAGSAGVSIVRADLPPPGGMGCSMIVTQCETHLGRQAQDMVIEAAVSMNSGRQGVGAWPATRDRQELLDNCGTRLLVKAELAHTDVDEPNAPTSEAVDASVTSSGIREFSCVGAFPLQAKAIDEESRVGLFFAASVEGEANSQTDLSFGDLVCRGSKTGLCWVRADDGVVVHRLPLPEPVTSVQWTSVGSLFAHGSHGGAWAVSLSQNRLPCSFQAVWGQLHRVGEAALIS